MAGSRFREDLYFRLNVGNIQLSPQQGQKDDLPLLLDYYLQEINGRFECEVQGFSQRDFAWLIHSYHKSFLLFEKSIAAGAQSSKTAARRMPGKTPSAHKLAICRPIRGCLH